MTKAPTHIVSKTRSWRKKERPLISSVETPPLDENLPYEYSIDFYITDIDTRQFVGFPNPTLNRHKRADWQALYDLLHGQKNICITRTEWITDGGCIYQMGSYGAWMNFTFTTDTPLPIEKHSFAYPREDEPLFADNFNKHVAPWLWPLLDKVMTMGGEFHIYTQKMFCRIDKTVPEQLKLEI